MSSDISYEMEEFLEGLKAIAATNSLTSLIGLVGYVLGAIALYTLAKRRGIRHAWLAWIPVGHLWILGSLADQYQYVTHREVKNKRKTLLTLSIIQLVLSLIIAGVVTGSLVGLFTGAMKGAGEDELFATVMGPMLGVIFLSLPIGGIALAILIIRFMALYNVYQSCAPDNAVLFIVISIFIRFTEPFFLFFNRQYDKGMISDQARAQAQNQYQQPSYMNTPENGGTWQEPEQPRQAYQPPQETRQNPAGSPEPWTEKPEDQDPWNKTEQQ